jgi:hypothetical protein
MLTAESSQRATSRFSKEKHPSRSNIARPNQHPRDWGVCIFTHEWKAKSRTVAGSASDFAQPPISSAKSAIANFFVRSRVFGNYRSPGGDLFTIAHE